MKYIIIPCLNESLYIQNVIKECEDSVADGIVIVENGSDDGSLDIVKKNLSDKTEILFINMPLGHDIPKALGLHYALEDGGEYFIFFDGDMIGISKDDINTMFNSLESGVDLALTDCYCDGSLPEGLASYVLEFREMLNRELNIFSKINHASPSHGPIGLSKKLAQSIPKEYIGIPPLLLEYAVENNYNIDIGLKKLHMDLGSSERTEKHRLKMAETIVGDTIYAIRNTKKNITNRKYDGIEYTGFHENRRFDILELITKRKVTGS